MRARFASRFSSTRASPRRSPVHSSSPSRVPRGRRARSRRASRADARARRILPRRSRENYRVRAPRAESGQIRVVDARATPRRARVRRTRRRARDESDRFEPRVVAPFPSSRAARRVRTRRVRLPDARASPPLLSLSQTSARPRRSASGTSIRTGSRCARPLSNHLNVRRPRHVVATRAFLSGGG